MAKTERWLERYMDRAESRSIGRHVLQAGFAHSTLKLEISEPRKQRSLEATAPLGLEP